MQLAERVLGIKPSQTLEITAKAREMRKKGIDVISFASGEPDFPAPEKVKEAINEALKENLTYYAPSQGMVELREAIAEKLERENKIKCSEDNIIVTPGAKFAIYLALQSILNEGDEVILIEPFWVSYEPMVKLANAEPKIVKSIPEIREKISRKTRAIIINSPNNPSGKVLSLKELEEIANIANENDIFVISDEIYEKIIYDAEHVSIGSFNGIADKVITVNGFSKAYSMPGFRLGYACAEESIIKAMTKIQSHTVSSPTTFVQKAGITALRECDDYVRKLASEFKKRRDKIYKLLSEISDVYVEKPQGAFYAFPDFSYYEKDAMELAKALLEKAKVAVIPGIAFGKSCRGNIRISYAVSIEKIEEGMARIRKFVEEICRKT